MSKITLLAFSIILSAIILGGSILLRPTSVKDERITEVFQRIEELEHSVQNYISNTPAESVKTEEYVYEPNTLIAMSRRLGLLEALSTQIAKRILQTKQATVETPTDQDVPGQISGDEYLELLTYIENSIEELRIQFDAVFDSISPIANLSSPEAELLRANRFYHELKEPSTAVYAYTSMLERYSFTYDETLQILSNSTMSFSQAAENQTSFVVDNPAILISLEERIRELQPEDQGDLLSMLASACMHGNTYEDASRLYKEAINRLPDGEEKVSLYLSMAFALRKTEGDESFFATLKQGQELGLDIGIDVRSFEKELADPRDF